MNFLSLKIRAPVAVFVIFLSLLAVTFLGVSNVVNAQSLTGTACEEPPNYVGGPIYRLICNGNTIVTEQCNTVEDCNALYTKEYQQCKDGSYECARKCEKERSDSCTSSHGAPGCGDVRIGCLSSCSTVNVQCYQMVRDDAKKCEKIRHWEKSHISGGFECEAGTPCVQVCDMGTQCVQNGDDAKCVRSSEQPVPPPAEDAPPPIDSAPEKAAKDLVVDSFAPESIVAGKGILNPLSGFVHYETFSKPFLIEGKNLQGLTMSADNDGLDGEPGVTFSDIQVSGDGTVATGYIKSRGAAMDGQTTVTIRNSVGRSVIREIKVDITGTQYLKRTFGETVLFLGDWTDVVPNAHITDLENGLKDGLKYTWAIGYLKLRILPTMYEEGVWHLAFCPPDTQITAISGCASPGNKTIHLRDNPEEITPTIFHEAVHKLDFWHRGQYRGTPDAPMSPDGFFGSWVAAAARPEGYPPCQFLPLQNSVTWKDGTNEVPHCGFIVAYGASDRGGGEDVMAVGARENPANLVGFYEDVATMAESHIFSPGLFNLPEVSADPRYNKKVNLLRQYVFFP